MSTIRDTATTPINTGYIGLCGPSSTSSPARIFFPGRASPRPTTVGHRPMRNDPDNVRLRAGTRVRGCRRIRCSSISPVIMPAATIPISSPTCCDRTASEVSAVLTPPSWASAVDCGPATTSPIRAAWCGAEPTPYPASPAVPLIVRRPSAVGSIGSVGSTSACLPSPDRGRRTPLAARAPSPVAGPADCSAARWATWSSSRSRSGIGVLFPRNSSVHGRTPATSRTEPPEAVI